MTICRLLLSICIRCNLVPVCHTKDEGWDCEIGLPIIKVIVYFSHQYPYNTKTQSTWFNKHSQYSTGKVYEGLFSIPTNNSIQFKPTNIQSMRTPIGMGMKWLKPEVAIKVLLSMWSNNWPTMRSTLNSTLWSYKNEFSLFWPSVTS